MKVLAQLLALVVGSAAIGLFANALRPDGLALFSGADVPAALCTATGGKGPVSLDIQADRARELVAAGAVLIDARSADDFARGHAPGARHQPCAAKLGELPRGAAVVVYDGGEQTTATEVARALRGRGLEAHVLLGGFQAWGRAGAPAESGACDDCGKGHATSSAVHTSSTAVTP